MKKDDYQQEFGAILSKIAYESGFHTFDVFSDFLTCTRLSLTQAVRFKHEDESKYLKTIQKYNKDQAQQIASLLRIVVMALEAEPHDFFWEFYMSQNFGEAKKGQFFTPDYVCDLMSQMLY